MALELPASAGPGSRRTWTSVAFVWAEVDAAAQRLLHEVDVLARAYGWTEPEVLALSEARRAAYLRLVRGRCAVTGYLERMAARAAGRAAGGRPEAAVAVRDRRRHRRATRPRSRRPRHRDPLQRTTAVAAARPRRRAAAAEHRTVARRRRCDAAEVGRPPPAGPIRDPAPVPSTSPRRAVVGQPSSAAPHAARSVRPRPRTRRSAPTRAGRRRTRRCGPVAAVPATHRRDDRGPPARDEPPGGAPEPRGPDVVHVSIGRVEVRATLAAARLPRPRPAVPADAAPTLSLHDYLSGKREST